MQIDSLLDYMWRDCLFSIIAENNHFIVNPFIKTKPILPATRMYPFPQYIMVSSMNIKFTVTVILRENI